MSVEDPGFECGPNHNPPFSAKKLQISHLLNFRTPEVNHHPEVFSKVFRKPALERVGEGIIYEKTP
ncbi:hypothetical protein [Mucilaginibacter segetis]|uniref:Uncharacterized protein n=1 Tax=Mucilaginibacter segetis TaxID=2793071 RepID=A0A934PT53_9SPHI|nr:hypothetical protein [Mucilaginibacter segetis]MBK0378575.1 hypothetical protein [Mucilaginibacter segetis]